MHSFFRIMHQHPSSTSPEAPKAAKNNACTHYSPPTRLQLELGAQQKLWFENASSKRESSGRNRTDSLLVSRHCQGLVLHSRDRVRRLHFVLVHLLHHRLEGVRHAHELVHVELPRELLQGLIRHRRRSANLFQLHALALDVAPAITAARHHELQLGRAVPDHGLRADDAALRRLLQLLVLMDDVVERRARNLLGGHRGKQCHLGVL
mmetsp:Transcript_25825/g.49036  ORF Transcript_25825/g.49036 Transcript_25825/m.49036 type:complete len:207 (+) Transcript_25825:330-950(+)